MTAQSEAQAELDALIQQTRRSSLAEVPLASPFYSGGLVDVFRKRYLLKLLVNKELSSRYQGSVLGVFWSYIQPLVRFSMYFFVIGLVLNQHKGFPNYAIHMFCAVVAVHFFTETFSSGTRSIIKNKAIVRKSAIPGEMFPVATVIVSAVNTFPMLLILFVASVASGWKPDIVGICAALLGMAIVTVLGTALALLFSGLNVYFRDFQNVVSTFSLFTHWIVPMIYPFVKLADSSYGRNHTFFFLYMCNPLTTAVVLLQRAFWIPTSLGEPILKDRFPTNANDVGWPYLPHHVMLLGLLMLAVSLVILVLCQMAFRRLEGKFAERL